MDAILNCVIIVPTVLVLIMSASCPSPPGIYVRSPPVVIRTELTKNRRQETAS
jgi:hypothetical protein